MTIKAKKYPALYQASLELFATFGYKKTTVEDVADKLDMTKGNLSFYVKNKGNAMSRPSPTPCPSGRTR